LHWQDPPPLNFEEWKKEIDPKLVEMFQKAFQGALHCKLRRLWSQGITPSLTFASRP
jgi:hypothetical protein